MSMSSIKLRLAPIRATSLKQVLALKDPPAGGLGWLALIESGLPARSLHAVAKSIGITDTDLAHFLGIDLANLEENDTLGQTESDLLFAVARAYARAATRMGTEQARAWMVAAHPAFQGRAPIDALRTRVGTEYVSGLINQIGQRPTDAREGTGEHTASASSATASDRASVVAP